MLIFINLRFISFLEALLDIKFTIVGMIQLFSLFRVRKYVNIGWDDLMVLELVVEVEDILTIFLGPFEFFFI